VEDRSLRVAWTVLLAVALAAGFGVATSAQAADQAIAGRLTLRQSGARQKLTFVSRDPAFLFPVFGGPNDPATGSPGGALIDLFSQNEGTALLAVPRGTGKPGWTHGSRRVEFYRFRNPRAPGSVSPVGTVVLRRGRLLEVTARATGLPLVAPQGTVGIRFTMGTLRNCALFGGSTVRRDRPGLFVAQGASASLADCSDGSLGALTTTTSSTTTTTIASCGLFPECNGPCPDGGVCGADFGFCRCISPNSPCGETGPVCNGTCPAGDECVANGPGPLNGCMCLPVGATPCGAPGPPVCGGACPAGLVCRAGYGLPILGGQLGCACTVQGPCGQGGADCPNGFACGILPPGPAQCFPVACGGGSYPTCGGTCVQGAECQAVHVPTASVNLCVCALPAPCDASCGGYSCSAGEVCTIDTQGHVCACAAP
jgi:hypothetical protein